MANEERIRLIITVKTEWLGRVDKVDPERRPFHKRNLRTRGE